MPEENQDLALTVIKTEKQSHKGGFKLRLRSWITRS